MTRNEILDIANEAAVRDAVAFSQAHPIGTAVYYKPFDRPNDEYLGTISSHAFVLRGDTPVVMIKDESLAIPTASVRSVK